MSYSLMIAPFDFANHDRIATQQFFDNYAFFELTPKQAKEYFLWYTSEIPNRIALLWEYMKQDRPGTEPFDYSPESLLPLWEWYETKIERVPMSKKEIEYQVTQYPKWIENEIRKEVIMKYTDETLSLALDISIYLGETVLKNYPNLYWGYRTKPKNEFSANRPVILKLVGKRPYFNPSRIVFVLMVKFSKGDNENSLYDLYRYWEQEYFIPSKPHE